MTICELKELIDSAMYVVAIVETELIVFDTNAVVGVLLASLAGACIWLEEHVLAPALTGPLTTRQAPHRRSSHPELLPQGQGN